VLLCGFAVSTINRHWLAGILLLDYTRCVVALSAHHYLPDAVAFASRSIMLIGDG